MFAELGFAEDLLSHWLEIRGDRLVPCRTELDPARLAQSLPRIWIGEFVPPDRLVIRLMGEELRGRVEKNPKGANFFDLCDPLDRPSAIERTRTIFAGPYGLHYTYDIFLGDDCVDQIEALLLPLSASAGVAPSLVINLTHRIGGRGLTAYDDRASRVVRSRWNRFVDIGAGLPEPACS